MTQAPISVSPERLLSDHRVVWAVTAVFVAVGLEAVSSLRALHDEGILTFHFASILAVAPIDALFFQKVRPTLALLYAPITPLGLRAFFAAHVLVAAAAIPLTARIAERLGHRAFVVPALVVAGSPLFLLAAPAGHSNTDAVVGLLAGLHLLVVNRRSLLAGLVLGSLIFVRSEVMPFLLILGIERAIAGDRRLALGMVIGPVVYGLGGAVYHQDLLWALHYPPTLASPVPEAHWVDAGRPSARLGATSDALLCLSPIVGMLVLLRARSLAPIERGLAVALAIFVLAIRGLPMIGLFNFDGAPRYLLVGLPALALALGRAIDAGVETARERGTLVGLALLSAIGWLTVTRGPSDLLLPAIAVWCVLVAMLASGRVLAAAASAALVLAIGFPLWPPRSWLEPPRDRLVALESWWREAEIEPSTPVVTNMRLARAWLELRGARESSEPPPWFVMQHDMSDELRALLDPRIGQDAAIFDAMDAHFFGRPVPTERLSVDAWSAGTIVVFDADTRLGETIDLDVWRARWIVEVDRPDLTVARIAGSRP